MLKNKIGYINIIALSIVLFIFYHNFFFGLFLLLMTVLPPISYFLSKKVWKNIEVKAEIPLVSVGEGNDIPINFTVKNPILPMPGVKLLYAVDNKFYPNEEAQKMSLPLRKGTHNYSWIIKSVYAGRVRLMGQKITMYDYTGLFRFEKEWNSAAAISIMPPESDIIMDVVEDTFTVGDEQERDSANATEDVTEIKEFREYIPGDKMQRVNWKISAKHDNPYVKVFEQEYNSTVTLLAELYRDSENIGFLDELLTAFYSAALKLIDMEMRFKVQWYDCETGRFMTETVTEADGLFDVMQQMYMMTSYNKFYALEKYKEEAHKQGDMTLYFTSPEFGGYDESLKIGTYKERVAIICL